MFDTIVDVIVGEGAGSKTFKLHKGVLCFYSSYFEKAFKGGFEEARKGVVELPTEDVDIFERFVLWLYTRRLDALSAQDLTLYGQLFRLWTFADRRGIPLLMNECMNAIRDEVVELWCSPLDMLHFIYANTVPSSGLRRFMIYIIGCCYNFKDNDEKDWPRDALCDLLRLKWNWDKSQQLTRSDVAKMDMCKYHEHDKDVTCSKKRKFGDT